MVRYRIPQIELSTKVLIKHHRAELCLTIRCKSERSKSYFTLSKRVLVISQRQTFAVDHHRIQFQAL